ncbi:MAG TPA: hypothetical protein VFV70_04220 [Hyphomonadaceae bacterium]|nr:hypothetical protein [Hyphomonadaceae bacterium]
MTDAIRALAEAPAANVAPAYEPTPQERMAAGRQMDRRTRKPPAPNLKLSGNAKNVALETDHASKPLGLTLLMEAFGTADMAFFNGLMEQLLNATPTNGKPDERALNFMAAMIHGIGPQDETECLLAAQMAAVHMATMTMARRLANVETLPQQDSAAQAFNKLARTFALQMEALKRYRTGGEQRVTVQHVTVNDGGKAIVGAVSQAPGGSANREAAP